MQLPTLHRLRNRRPAVGPKSEGRSPPRSISMPIPVVADAPPPPPKVKKSVHTIPSTASLDARGTRSRSHADRESAEGGGSFVDRSPDGRHASGARASVAKAGVFPITHALAARVAPAVRGLVGVHGASKTSPRMYTYAHVHIYVCMHVYICMYVYMHAYIMYYVCICQ